MPQKSLTRILIADPLPSFRTLYGQALREVGFDVFVARDEMQIFEVLAQHPMDIILLDPIMGDPELKQASRGLVENLQSRYPNLQVLLFSWLDSNPMTNLAKQETKTLQFLPKGDLNPKKMANYLRTRFCPNFRGLRHPNRQLEHEL